MRLKRILASLVPLAALVAQPRLLAAAQVTIQVKIKADAPQPEVTPPNPVVNVHAADTIVVYVDTREANNQLPLGSQGKPLMWEIQVAGIDTFPNSAGNSRVKGNAAAVTFNPESAIKAGQTKISDALKTNDPNSLTRQLVEIQLPFLPALLHKCLDVAAGDVRDVEEQRCCLAIAKARYAKADTETAAFLNEAATGWEVFGPAHAIHFAFEKADVDSWAGRRYLVPIDVRDVAWALQFSQGLAFLGTRDQRYQLTANKDDPNKQDLARLPDGSVPYRVAVYAHYVPIEFQHWALTAGLATDVPVSGLTAMVGGSISVGTMAKNEAAFLTVGACYSQYKALASDYEGKPQVPASVTTSTLMQTRSGVSWFVGLSFSFVGGSAEQFKGLMTGGGSSTQPK